MHAENPHNAPKDAAEAPDFGAVPADVLHLLFSQLPLKDLLHAASTCKSWNRCLPNVWRARCMQRWRHWREPPPADGAHAKNWRQCYVDRHTVDKHIMQLLANSACKPESQYDAYKHIMQHGAAALDVLTAAAGSTRISGLYIGVAYHAHTALLLIEGQQAAQTLQQLLASEQSGGAGTAAEAVSCSAFTAAEGAEGQQAHQQEDLVLEAALQVTRALRPLSDISAVRDVVHQLGLELQSRVEAAGVAPGSRKALELLNTLMFSEPPAAAPEPTAGGSSAQHQNRDSSLDSSSGSSSFWSTMWPRNDDLYGPDLSGFKVPHDGLSGLGLKGAPEVYETTAGSCLDSLLAHRAALPIIMCVLHRAVGRRAGLDVEMVNMPGQVINRVNIISTGHSDSSSHAVYVDVFVGKELGDDDLRLVWQQFEAVPVNAPWQEHLQTMTATAFCKRATNNLRVLHTSRSTQSLLLHATQEEDFDPRPPLLSVPLVCLIAGLLTKKSSTHDVMGPVLGVYAADAHHNKGLAELYTDIVAPLLVLQDEQATQEMQHCKRAIYRLNQMVPIHIQLQQQQQQQGKDHLHPAGTYIQSRHHPRAGTATDWEVQEEGVGVVQHVLGCDDKGCRVYLVSPELLHVVQTNPPCNLQPPAGAAQPSSSSYVELVKQAQLTLQQSWFEPGYPACVLARASAAEQKWHLAGGVTPQFEHLVSCSVGLGRYFDAVLFDHGLQQWCLVPNSYLRDKAAAA